MDLIETQRSAVAQHIHRENEQKWSEVPCSLREGVITAAHTGGYLGGPASGNRARFDHASGGLLGERLYLDHGALVQHLKRRKPLSLGNRSANLPRPPHPGTFTDDHENDPPRCP